MTPADRQAFAEIVTGFAELKGKSLSRAALNLYWNSMQHWPIEDFRAAAEELLRTCEFMPVPKDFEDLRKAGRATAGEAWARAVEACGSCYSSQGYTSGGTCGDLFIDRVVRAIGGYKAIAMCEEGKMHFLERRFAEHFDSMLDADDVRAAVPQLTFSSSLKLPGPQSVRNLFASLVHEDSDA